MPRGKQSAVNSTSQRGSQAGTSQKDEDSDMDDVGPSQSPTRSQAQHNLDKLTPAAVDRKMSEVVQYILIMEQRKIPVKRKDIIKHVLKEYRSRYTEIMKRTVRTFHQVFGLDLVEIDTKNHAYILVNKLDRVEGDNMNWGDATPKMGLLMVILSIIFMKGNVVKDSLLWHTLKKLRVDPSERHNDFGDVKKLITEEFVKQKYLDYSRVLHTDPVEYEFRWGPRASKETSKLKVLEFVAKMHNNQDPKTWATQYKEAHQEAAASSKN
ncbi:necdin-like 2 isoform X1 [Carcharodon carcharias]|uniref:necdin-like 2 isoform X1 n=1 Tax=Carcharodon carcharias TaxID=13397 RepID=UPI001B7EAE15|nr:necdin-like 2 isoform X1 [Carcharodon carcharias]XP_041035546.1 necdin-like 2 isoform X1 [Carcharodon carcharias]